MPAPTDHALAYMLDETSGSTAAELNGGVTLGTSGTGLTWVDGRHGKAAQFAGTSRLQSAAIAPSLSAAAGATMGAYVKLSATASTSARDVMALDDGTNVVKLQYLSGTTWKAGYYKGSTVEVTHVADLRDNAWHHVAVTIAVSGGTYTVQLYIDGAAAGTPATSSVIPATALTGIGLGDFRSGIGPGTQIDGALDEAVFYARALSATEIGQLATASLVPPPPGGAPGGGGVGTGTVKVAKAQGRSASATTTLNLLPADAVAGADRVLLAWIDDEATALPWTGATADGVPGTSLGTAVTTDGGGNAMQLFGWLDADLPSTNEGITIDVVGGDAGNGIIALLLTDAQQDYPTPVTRAWSASEMGALSGALPLPVTVGSGGSVAVAVTAHGGSPGRTGTAGDTLIDAVEPASAYMVGSYSMLDAGSATLTQQYTSISRAAGIGVVIAPSSGSTAPPEQADYVLGYDIVTPGQTTIPNRGTRGNLADLVLTGTAQVVAGPGTGLRSAVLRLGVGATAERRGIANPLGTSGEFTVAALAHLPSGTGVKRIAELMVGTDVVNVGGVIMDDVAVKGGYVRDDNFSGRASGPGGAAVGDANLHWLIATSRQGIATTTSGADTVTYGNLAGVSVGAGSGSTTRTGTVTPSSGQTFTNVRFTSPGGSNVSGTASDVTFRNCTFSGNPGVEHAQVSGRRWLFEHCRFEGTPTNHAIKVRGDRLNYYPGKSGSAKIRNCVFAGTPKEDHIQYQGQHGGGTENVIEYCTFPGVSTEDAIDLKSGDPITIRYCYFGSDGSGEGLLTQNKTGATIVHDNRFNNVFHSFGAHPEGGGVPDSTCVRNLFEGTSTLRIRKSTNLLVQGNTFGGSTKILAGLSGDDDPSAAYFKDNTLGSGTAVTDNTPATCYATGNSYQSTKFSWCAQSVPSWYASRTVPPATGSGSGGGTTLSGAESRLYLDGTEIGAVTNASAPAFPAFDGVVLGGGYVGDIAAVRVWDRILSTAERSAVGQVAAAPTPVATASPSSVSVGTSFTLSSAGSTDPGGLALTYRWAWVSSPAGAGPRPPSNPTGATSVQPTAGWQPGDYIYRLTATNSGGGVATADVTVALVAGNVPPSATAGGDAAGRVGVAWERTGVASDPDGTIVAHAWELAGTPSGSAATISGAATATVGLTPDLAGSYTLRYRARDDDNAWSPWSLMTLRVGVAVGEVLTARLVRTPAAGVATTVVTVRVRLTDGTSIASGATVAKVDKLGLIVGGDEWVPGGAVNTAPVT